MKTPQPTFAPELLHLTLAFFWLFFCLTGGASASAAEINSAGTIGTTVVPTSVGHLVVLQVMKESPAARQGILPGDLIIEVNGFNLTGSDFSRVAKEKLWGKVGSDVELKVLRPGKEGVRTLHLKRATATEKPVVLPGVKLVLPDKNQ